MRLWVKVFSVRGSEDRIVVGAAAGPALGVVMMYFHNQHDHLSMLRSDDRILVQGEIADIGAISLTLENCELLSVGDEEIA